MNDAIARLLAHEQDPSVGLPGAEDGLGRPAVEITAPTVGARPPQRLETLAGRGQERFRTHTVDVTNRGPPGRRSRSTTAQESYWRSFGSS